MEIKYTCRNNNCSYPGSDRFEMRLNLESIMDNNNIATTFCPFCKSEMFPVNTVDGTDTAPADHPRLQ